MKLFSLLCAISFFSAPGMLSAAQVQQTKLVNPVSKVLDATTRSAIFAAGPDDKKLKKVIASEKFDVNATVQPAINKTLLMITAENGRENIVKALLKKPGINLDLQNPTGLTALSIASKTGNAEIVKLVLEAGADREILDVHHQSYRDYAQAHPEVVRIIHEFETRCKKELQAEATEQLSGIAPLGALVGEYLHS